MNEDLGGGGGRAHEHRKSTHNHSFQALPANCRSWCFGKKAFLRYLLGNNEESHNESRFDSSGEDTQAEMATKNTLGKVEYLGLIKPLLQCQPLGHSPQL